MEITKEDFDAYRTVQFSGVTNMFDIKNVMVCSGLTKAKCMDIMANYSDLKEKFGEFKGSARAKKLKQAVGQIG